MLQPEAHSSPRMFCSARWLAASSRPSLSNRNWNMAWLSHMAVSRCCRCTSVASVPLRAAEMPPPSDMSRTLRVPEARDASEGGEGSTEGSPTALPARGASLAGCGACTADCWVSAMVSGSLGATTACTAAG
jgi:hypothetical protein